MSDISNPEDSETTEGLEKKRLQERRRVRSGEGRERYLDMVQRERALLLDQGIARSTEQLLDMAGAVTAEIDA